MRTTTTITIALATGLLAFSGCSDGSDQAQERAFNDADVEFAQMMIPHHSQAIEMSQIVLSKDGVDPEVAQLAEEIQSAQGPEIDQMNSWLDDWDAQPEGHGGMDHGGEMDGMLSAEDLEALRDAPGAAAGPLFLEQMIEHHEGAVQMAEAHQDEGENAEALTASAKIIADQRSEIEQMERLLQRP